jgi:hypothetical protein
VPVERLEDSRPLVGSHPARPSSRRVGFSRLPPLSPPCRSLAEASPHPSRGLRLWPRMPCDVSAPGSADPPAHDAITNLREPKGATKADDHSSEEDGREEDQTGSEASGRQGSDEPVPRASPAPLGACRRRALEGHQARKPLTFEARPAIQTRSQTRSADSESDLSEARTLHGARQPSDGRVARHRARVGEGRAAHERRDRHR